MEQILYALLLAIHNILLVVLTGGLFTVWTFAKLFRGHGREFLRPADFIMEKNALAQPHVYLLALIGLAATGCGLPFVHVLYHGHTRSLTPIASAAFGLKMLLVFLLAALVIRWWRSLQASIKTAFEKAAQTGNATDAGGYFRLVDRRERICFWGWAVAFALLAVTPVIVYF